MEEARQKIRTRAEESRKKRAEQMLETTPDISSLSTSNDDFNKSFEEDDEDISIIDEKSLLKLEEDIEELSSGTSELRQRHPAGFIDASIGTSEQNLESTC